MTKWTHTHRVIHWIVHHVCWAFFAEWCVWVHMLRVDLSSRGMCAVKFIKPNDWRRTVLCSGIRDPGCRWPMWIWISPWYFICESTEDTASLMCRSSAVHRCHLWHEQAQWGLIKLATMSAWKQLSVWPIYQTEVKYLAQGHLVSCLRRASISYLIQIMQDIPLHSDTVTCHRRLHQALVPCASSVLWRSQVWSGVHPVVPLNKHPPKSSARILLSAKRLDGKVKIWGPVTLQAPCCDLRLATAEWRADYCNSPISSRREMGVALLPWFCSHQLILRF